METLEALKALSDESRLRLVHILKRGYFNVQELTSILKVTQSTISHHLKILQGAGIVKNHREGTWIYYSLQNGDSGPSAGKEFAECFLRVAESDLDSDLQSLLRLDTAEASTLLAKRRDQSHRFFESVANKWKEIRSEIVGEDFLDLLSSEIPPEKDLLELGCGSGALFERILPRSGQTIGVDYSQAMLDETRSTLGKRADTLDLRLGNLEHLPLGDESVDLVVAYMVFHHVPDPSEALHEIYRVLKPGGELRIIDLVKHDKEFMRERFADHWLGFDPKTFQGWEKTAGFQNLTTKILGAKKEVFYSIGTKK